MGLGFVLLIWGVLAAILAVSGAAVFGGTTALLTKGVKQGRIKAIIAASMFPFLCVGWGGAVFIFQAVVNETFLNRDPGMGDTWKCPLPNGYALLMIDVTEYGWVYNPKTQSGSAVGPGDDSIGGVRLVQVSGPFIFGGADSQVPRPIGEDTASIDTYFLLNAKTGTRQDFSSLKGIQDAAHQNGVELKLEPIHDVYFRYRPTWFDTLQFFLFFVPLLVAAGLMVAWIIRLRKSREVVPLSA